jgi:hypothetical protein
MFQLTRAEFDNLKSQFVTSSSHGGRRKLPLAFTEQGVAMLSSVLRSKRAVQVNVQIMRTFVRLRLILSSHADLARKLEQLEQKYDKQFRSIFDADPRVNDGARSRAAGAETRANRISHRARANVILSAHVYRTPDKSYHPC